ncbi:hypothetical protein PHAVU_006G041700, partial [Phaseolus vulgaris]
MYVTFVRSVKSIVRFALKCFRPSGWGVTALAIKKIKQKHKWGGQLLTILMETPYLDMEIAGGEQSMKFTREDNYLDPFFLTKEQLETGTVDLVNELQNKVQTALNESTDPEKENLLVVAMKNIKYKLGEHHVDKKETTFFTTVKNGIVEIVFELQSKIPSVVHETNSNNENESSEWMKETSNSCSVVAILVVGVSFATSTFVPGGTNNAKPKLEGQSALDLFAIASLIGVCFSVTALIMLLAILTSRKQFQDFQMSLPLKLIFGLSSLFVSISSMLVSFCARHFFVLMDKYKNILFPVYIATCLPITFS